MFIGNTPFIVSEEELREFFVGCGEIENVRLVRDPKTFLGKGIGYVMFKNKEEMQKAIKEKDGAKFKGRELRVKRAVDPKRREKKQRKKQEALEERRKKRLKAQGEAGSDDEEDLPRNFEDAYSSEDSDDEKPLPKVVKLSDTNFGKKNLDL